MSSSYQTPTSRSAVRDYVTASTSAQAQSHDTVLLRVTHTNLTAVFPELRLSRAMTVGEVKQKLYQHTGTRPAHMRVLLLRGGAPPGVPLLEDARPLGFYSPAAGGDALRVVDDDPHSASAGGWLENVELVEKFRLSDEAYAARENTYAKHREQMRKNDPKWTMNRELAKRRGEGKGATGVEGDLPEIDVRDEEPGCTVGDRVEVTPGGKRGLVKFVGKALQGLPEGWWVGVRYDEPVGKNDGMVKGVRYFEAEMRYGGLVRPSKVEVGDFPPLDEEELFGDDDEDEI